MRKSGLQLELENIFGNKKRGRGPVFYCLGIGIEAWNQPPIENASTI